jgi:hypothetical protein
VAHQRYSERTVPSQTAKAPLTSHSCPDIRCFGFLPAPGLCASHVGKRGSATHEICVDRNKVQVLLSLAQQYVTEAAAIIQRQEHLIEQLSRQPDDAKTAEALARRSKLPQMPWQDIGKASSSCRPLIP